MTLIQSFKQNKKYLLLKNIFLSVANLIFNFVRSFYLILDVEQKSQTRKTEDMVSTKHD